MKIIDCEQGSPEWYGARLGLPTASMFATVLAKGRDGEKDAKASKTRAEYMRKLAGEIITGEPMENYANGHMERGKAMEDEARDLYAFLSDEPLQRVGFILSQRTGCSPDSLVGDRGMLEIKTALPHILIDKLLRGEFPPEHKAQCQGNLWVAEREWIDLQIFWPKLPPFIIRAQRDEAYIGNLAGAVHQFNAELHELVERIRAYEGRREAA